MSPFLHVRFPAVDSSRIFFRFHPHTQTTSLAMHYTLAWDLLPISREPTSAEPLLGGAHAWVTVWVGRARDVQPIPPPGHAKRVRNWATMVPRCWPRLAPCHSADHAAIVLEHGCRLDHVRERRHLLVAEHLLEHREPSACLMAVGGWGGRVWGCDANTFWQNLQLAGSPDSPADFRKSSKNFACAKKNLPDKNLPVFKKKS